MTAKAPGEQGAALAQRMLCPSIQAAVTLKEYAKGLDGVPVMGLVEELAVLSKAVQGGDLTRAETMLVTQAHTLDALYNSLARRAMKAEHMNIFDRYLRLALKAQSQCRATLETLAVIKNPPVVYARQANIAHNQQVNNQTALPPAHAGNQEINQTEYLLEVQHDEGLDTGTPGATVAANPHLAAVGAGNGAENG